MPALKPISTGSEMKLATKPRRSSEASTRIAPTSNGEGGGGGEQRGWIAVRQRQRQIGAGEDGEGGGRADAERPRGAEERVYHHRHERGVEPDLDRQAGDRGVRHRLGDDDGGGGQAGDEIGAHPGGAAFGSPIGQLAHGGQAIWQTRAAAQWALGAGSRVAHQTRAG